MKRHNIAFYNLENLFDLHDDPYTLDDDFTPKSEKRWNRKRYEKKLKKLGSVIAKIGADELGEPPAIVGIAEVENKTVIRDLVGSKHLRKLGYRYVHFDAPDERGIDTALLYRDTHFEVLESKTIAVLIHNPDGERDYTRDILYVKGLLDGAPVHLMVNHWPSRRAGAELTEYKRIKAAQTCLEMVHEVRASEPEADLVIMGDFNDNPDSASIKEHLVPESFYNPMEKLHTRKRGSSKYRDSWYLFDQILVSESLRSKDKFGLRFEQAEIFDPIYLREYSGRFKGNPFRTYVGKKHLGGFSDHFPVYASFTIHKF
ncbi:endonuclease [Gilvibacter sediminis]|uniref:endonuclease/exonuclease/phosphatase family protein n=1 Tax=Gilvibacter sediminis TaxID=379071 RepID=UPI002350E55E|nr:endonuclease [Gilvibacter sediminis]MDC7997069.1 endonuclease [Gilvibacter sediminis]